MTGQAHTECGPGARLLGRPTRVGLGPVAVARTTVTLCRGLFERETKLKDPGILFRHHSRILADGGRDTGGWRLPLVSRSSPSARLGQLVSRCDIFWFRTLATRLAAAGPADSLAAGPVESVWTKPWALAAAATAAEAAHAGRSEGKSSSYCQGKDRGLCQAEGESASQEA